MRTHVHVRLRRLRAHLSSDNDYRTTHADQRTWTPSSESMLTRIPVHTAERKHADAHAHIPDTHRILTRMRAFYTTTPSPTR